MASTLFRRETRGICPNCCFIRGRPEHSSPRTSTATASVKATSSRDLKQAKTSRLIRPANCGYPKSIPNNVRTEHINRRVEGRRDIPNKMAVTYQPLRSECLRNRKLGGSAHTSYGLSRGTTRQSRARGPSSVQTRGLMSISPQVFPRLATVRENAAMDLASASRSIGG